MNKYFLSLGGFAIALILVGAGCNSTTTNTTDSDVVLENTIKTEVVDTKTEQKADIVVNLTGKNFSFSQDEIKVTEGDIVTINFESTQGFHDFVIDAFDAKTERVNAGSKTSITFVADKAGEYEYYCSVGLHRKQGMVGTLTVEASTDEASI